MVDGRLRGDTRNVGSGPRWWQFKCGLIAVTQLTKTIMTTATPIPWRQWQRELFTLVWL